MSCPTNEYLDPRVRRTRNLLLDAMRALILEKHFSDISVQDVAERATVNRATFYAHYPDKNALLTNVLQADFQAYMKSRFEECFPPFTQDGMRQMVSGMIQFIGDKLTTCTESVRDMEQVASAALLAEFHDIFKCWLEKEHPAAFEQHPPELVATVLSWGVYGAALRWSHSKRKRTAEEVADSVVTLMMPTVLLAA